MTHPPDTPTAFRFFNEIGIINQLGSTAFERAMPDGMTMAQFSVLNHFVRLGGERTPSDLARSFQVTKGAMTNTLGRLEGRAYVCIRTNPADGRGKLVSITDEGCAAHRQAIGALAPKLERLMQEFTEEELAAALPLLERVRVWLDNNRD